MFIYLPSCFILLYHVTEKHSIKPCRYAKVCMGEAMHSISMVCDDHIGWFLIDNTVYCYKFVSAGRLMRVKRWYDDVECMTSAECVIMDPESYCYTGYCTCTVGSVLLNGMCTPAQFCLFVSVSTSNQPVTDWLHIFSYTKLLVLVRSLLYKIPKIFVFNFNFLLGHLAIL